MAIVCVCVRVCFGSPPGTGCEAARGPPTLRSLSLSLSLSRARSLSLSRALSRSRSRSRLLSLFRELRPITVVHSMMKPVVPDRSSTITVKIVTSLRIPSLRSSKSANPVCHED